MMKHTILNVLAIISLCMHLIPASCQTDKKANKIKVPAELVKYADRAAGIKYQEKLNQALTGDVNALILLLDFHRYADGAEGNMHSDVLLELLYAVGDEAFAVGCMGVKPKLKSTVIERMVFAQGRATRPELKAPIAEWAPKTFAILTGGTMPADPNAPSGEPAPAPTQETSTAPTDAASPQATEPSPAASPSLTEPTANPGALAAPQPQAAEEQAPSNRKKKKNKE